MRMQDSTSFRAVHDGLLQRYASLATHIPSAKDRLSLFRKATASYLPDAPTYAAWFQAETALPDEAQSADMLREIYHAWKRRDALQATLAWAAWLLRRGRGKDANDAVQSARAQAGAQRQALDDEWRKVLLRPQPTGAEQEEEEEDVDMHDDSVIMELPAFLRALPA